MQESANQPIISINNIRVNDSNELHATHKTIWSIKSFLKKNIPKTILSGMRPASGSVLDDLEDSTKIS